MKNLLLGAVSAVALLAAGSAFAAGNASTIDQIGFDNNAAVDQSGSPSGAVAVIDQGLAATQTTDAFNHANVTQGGGAGNQALITQSQGAYGAVSNPSNVSNSDQQGTDGSVTVVQVGDNSSSVSQLNVSSNEFALVGQSHSANSSSIIQGGNSEFALVNQEDGTGNSANIGQSGTGAGNIAPRAHAVAGPNNLVWSENVPGSPEVSVLPGAASGLTAYGPTGASVDQVGSNNVGNVNQAGFQNFADVSQENDSSTGGNTGFVSQGASLFQSDGLMYQLGQNNIASINQSGGGTTYSTVWQNGNSNQAYSTQIDSEHSVIGQGVDGDGNCCGAPAVNNDYASVDQTTGGDNSLVTQLGSNDTAFVSQTSTANATSTITQGGSFNVASVHQ